MGEAAARAVGAVELADLAKVVAVFVVVVGLEVEQSEAPEVVAELLVAAAALEAHPQAPAAVLGVVEEVALAEVATVAGAWVAVTEEAVTVREVTEVAALVVAKGVAAVKAEMRVREAQKAVVVEAAVLQLGPMAAQRAGELEEVALAVGVEMVVEAQAEVRVGAE